MNADDDSDGQELIIALELVMQSPEVPTDNHENSKLAFACHHQPVVARVSDTSIKIGSDDDAHHYVKRSVDIIMHEHQHFGQICFVAQFGHFLNQRVDHFDKRNRLRLTFAELSHELFQLTV